MLVSFIFIWAIAHFFYAFYSADNCYDNNCNDRYGKACAQNAEYDFYDVNHIFLRD